MKTISVHLIFVTLIILSACRPCANNDTRVSLPAATMDTGIFITGVEIADTIIYDVIIKNPNPEDVWTSKCLKGFKKSVFVEQLFESIYSGEKQEFEYFSNKELSANDLKKLEKSNDFSRDRIGKIQFVEKWFYDIENQVMTKKVISVSLGYELFDYQGNLVGYRPAFKVHLD